MVCAGHRRHSRHEHCPSNHFCSGTKKRSDPKRRQTGSWTRAGFPEFCGCRHIVRHASHVGERADTTYKAKSTDTLMVIRGIKRLGYLTNIEVTSIVLTGFTFFVLICLAMAIVFGLIKLAIELFAKARPNHDGRFSYFRQNWRSMLKGAILRMVYIGFPNLLILSFWEFTQNDSAAVIVLAVFFFLLSAGILAWNAFKVFIIGQRSMASYQTPAYLLYSDPQVINKYGFLYIQFAASHYYFIGVVLVYTFCKSCFIGFAQASGKTQDWQSSSLNSSSWPSCAGSDHTWTRPQT
jgi:hypothetical protein